tara:strand:- start:2 stop:727 length:726 start_codon:yes stop_codon:yes gene_type:complete
MAKAKTQFGNKSTNAVRQLVEESRTGRANSYKLFSIIILDFYINLGTHDARVAGFFGEHKNSISDSAKQAILKFVADNGFDVKASSETTVRKCWGKIKTASSERKLTIKIDDSDHKSIDAIEVLKQIEADEIVINIANNATVIQVKGQDPNVNWRARTDKGVKGKVYNAVHNLDGTVVIKTTRDGKLSNYVLKVTKPEECKNAKQVKACRVYWVGQLAKAQAEIDALKPMERAGKFKACTR